MVFELLVELDLGLGPRGSLAPPTRASVVLAERSVRSVLAPTTAPVRSSPGRCVDGFGPVARSSPSAQSPASSARVAPFSSSSSSPRSFAPRSPPRPTGCALVAPLRLPSLARWSSSCSSSASPTASRYRFPFVADFGPALVVSLRWRRGGGRTRAPVVAWSLGSPSTAGGLRAAHRARSRPAGYVAPVRSVGPARSPAMQGPPSARVHWRCLGGSVP